MNNENLMKKISIIGVVLMMTIITVIMGLSYRNKEARLENEYKAQRDRIEIVHDNMWKQIKQVAQVSDKYAQKFDEIYAHIIGKRYDKSDGVLMNWIKESNPNFSPVLYEKLSVVIEVERHRFLDAQTKIIDIVREQNNMMDVVPDKWFLFGRQKLVWDPISSTRSKAVMETRLDNDIDVFE